MIHNEQSRRMQRLFADDGRSVMLALDAHNFSAAAQLVDAAVASVPEMAELGLDAVLVPYGIASRRVTELKDVGLVLRCDASTNVFDPAVPRTQLVNSALDAIQVDADAVVVMTFPGADHAADVQDATQDLAHEAGAYEMPLIVEALPYSYAGVGNPGAEPDVVATGARFAEELGADVIKTRLTGTDADKKIIAGVHAPVLALGGPKTDLEGYLEYVGRCLDAGARGVAVGRNVVNDPNPVAKIAALTALIHGGSSVEAALRIYQGA